MRKWVNQLLFMGFSEDADLLEQLGRKFFNLDLLIAQLLPLSFFIYYFLIGVRGVEIFLVLGFVFAHYLLQGILTFLGGYRISVYLVLLFNIFLVSFAVFFLHLPLLAFVLLPVGINVFIYLPAKFRITVPLFFAHILLASLYFFLLTNRIPESSWQYISYTETPLVFGALLAIIILSFYKILMLVYMFSKVLEHSKRLEKKTKRIQASNRLGIIVLDENWQITSINPAFHQILGFTRLELLNQPLEQFLESSIDQKFGLLESGNPRDLEVFLTFIRKNGEKKVLRSFLQGHYQEDGSFKSAVLIAFDVTAEIIEERSKELNSKMIEEMLQGLPCVYYRFNDKLEFLESKGPALAHIGLLENQVVGQRIDVLYHVYPEIVKPHKEVFKKRFQKYQACIHYEGKEIFFDTTIIYYPEHKEGVGMAVDITEKVLAERKLAISRRKYLDIFETTDQAILVADPKEIKVVECNQAAVEIFGCESKDDFKGAPASDFTAPIQPDGEKYEDLSLRILNEVQSKGIFHERLLGRRKNGKLFWKEIKVIIDKNELVEYFIFFIKDISSEIQHQPAIETTDLKYQALFENNLDGLLILDLRVRKAIESNPRAAELFGLTKEELLNSNPIDLMPPFQSDGAPTEITFRKYMRQKQREGKARYHWDFLHKDGSIFKVEVMGFMLPPPDDHLMVYCIRDITERLQQEQVIRKNMDSLQKLNEELKSYIASNIHLEHYAHMASHDLQSPVRSILAFSSFLSKELGDDLQGRSKEFLDRIMYSAKDMEKLIDKLLAFSKVGQGGFSKESIELHPFFTNLKEEHSDKIEPDQLDIDLSKAPKIVFGDPIFLKMLWNNLLSNAIKYQNKDRKLYVKIGTCQKDDSFRFFIEDNGKGISSGDLENIFDLFFRGESATSVHGHGIGLAICKKIVEVHGGQLFVQSEVGKGTRFSYSINVNPV